jgi:excisionase family DNA binding protein
MGIPKLLTIDEVAHHTRSPRSTIFHWIYTKKLRSIRVGRRRLVAERDLVAFLGVDSSAPPAIDVARPRRR